jgi:hypothetical protein
LAELHRSGPVPLARVDLRPVNFSLAWKTLAELHTALSGSNTGGLHPSTRSAAFAFPSSGRWSPGDGEESVSLSRSLPPGNCPEDFEGAENHVIVAPVIRASLAQANPAETSGPRDHKRFRNRLAVEIAVVLAPDDFRPRGVVARALNCPILQVRVRSVRSNRAMRWFAPEPLISKQIRSRAFPCEAKDEFLFPRSAAFQEV